VVKFRSFYNSYREKLFGYLVRITGDYYLSCDLMQESFTRYLKRYGKREQSGSLLFGIARNALLDYQRKSKRDVRFEDHEDYAQYDPEHHLMIREQYRRVLSAMQELGEKEREALALVVSSSLSYREIAEITNTSEQNVKVRVHRARIKLKKVFEKKV
jgi:RNA polymerase sigma-70 factor (ECF subfamily)